ncbi:MAG TPA: hypothetical protein VME43_11025 [Bryobacteraceae bacterium]|nr:hypothetical protein [Bryobacteraceae bacterium]
MHRPGMISIWFFIGALLLAYGLLICGAGIYELISPPEHPVVLAGLHAGVWWGALLIALGAIYTIKFAPGKGN